MTFNNHSTMKQCHACKYYMMRPNIAHPSKCHLFCLKVVKLIDVFPYGTGFVLVFEYMLSDLSEVLRNSDKPLTEASAQ